MQKEQAVEWEDIRDKGLRLHGRKDDPANEVEG
jgi:hypothetical protein